MQRYAIETIPARVYEGCCTWFTILVLSAKRNIHSRLRKQLAVFVVRRRASSLGRRRTTETAKRSEGPTAVNDFDLQGPPRAARDSGGPPARRNLVLLPLPPNSRTSTHPTGTLIPPPRAPSPDIRVSRTSTLNATHRKDPPVRLFGEIKRSALRLLDTTVAQVYSISGAGSCLFWRRYDFAYGICAANRARTHSSGAGPHLISTPAPKTWRTMHATAPLTGAPCILALRFEKALDTFNHYQHPP